MTTICAQFKDHFPIVKGMYEPKLTALSDKKFTTSRCWDLWQVPSQRLTEFDPVYERTQLPLNERIVRPNIAEDGTFLIDSLITLTLPTVHTVANALEFWEGRKTVAICSAGIFGALTLGVVAIAKPAAALIAKSMPVLGVIFLVMAAAYIVLGTVFAGFNYRYYLVSQEEIKAWKGVQQHLPVLATVPERIAEIRAQLLTAYHQGKEVIADQRQEMWGCFVAISEMPILLKEGVTRAFPNLSPVEKELKTARKLFECNVRLQPSDEAIWDYRFPDFITQPMR